MNIGIIIDKENNIHLENLSNKTVSLQMSLSSFDRNNNKVMAKNHDKSVFFESDTVEIGPYQKCSLPSKSYTNVIYTSLINITARADQILSRTMYESPEYKHRHLDRAKLSTKGKSPYGPQRR